MGGGLNFALSVACGCLGWDHFKESLVLDREHYGYEMMTSLSALVFVWIKPEIQTWNSVFPALCVFIKYWMYLYLLEKKIPRYAVALVVAVMSLSLRWAKFSEVKVSRNWGAVCLQKDKLRLNFCWILEHLFDLWLINRSSGWKVCAPMEGGWYTSSFCAYILEGCWGVYYHCCTLGNFEFLTGYFGVPRVFLSF